MLLSCRWVPETLYGMPRCSRFNCWLLMWSGVLRRLCARKALIFVNFWWYSQQIPLLHKVSGTRLLVQQRRMNQEFWGSPSKLAQKLPRYLHCSNMLFSNGDLHHKIFLEISSLDLNYVSKLKWEILLSHENFREPRLTFFLLKTRQNAKVFLDRERLMEHHDGNTETFRVRKVK